MKKKPEKSVTGLQGEVTGQGYTPGPWRPFTRYVLANGRFIASALCIGDKDYAGQGFASGQEPTGSMNEAEGNAPLLGYGGAK